MQPSVHRDARARKRGRLRRVAAVVLATGSAVAGCANPAVPKANVYVTRDQRVVLLGGPLHPGETIFHVENDDGARHVVVLTRLDATTAGSTGSTGTERLPTKGQAVPTGGRSEQSYRGTGYRVVAKSEPMAAYFNGPNRVKAEFHLYLRAGRYILFANEPGDYHRGEFVEFTVSP